MTIMKADLDLANYVFADESGKFQDKDFICLCGFLSSGAKWDSFTAHGRSGRRLSAEAAALDPG